MTDFKLNPVTNDIIITKGRPETVEARDEIAQHIRSRLLIVRGEWFLDKDFGLDYYGKVWVRLTPRAVLLAHIRREILKEASVGDKVTELDFTYDGRTRTFSVTAKLVGADGITTSVST